MEEFIRLLDEHLAHIRHEIIGDTIYVHVKSNRDQPSDLSILWTAIFKETQCL